ncbi:UDP-glucosyltransferase [Bacillus pumilus]|uniref:macrolide family glycosyltransferase n=1 Tax=Bacillus pumilus TaxID=1408 RepID=UPI002B2550A4|nr:macrolide family glycosyltransferase [Bacillus pumilus]MEB2356403.1 UDP-glucosyltransferase [Bacillus pumilus]
MAKILLITFPAEGHVNPMLGIIKAWADRGDEVHAVTTVHYEERIKRLGAHVHKHPDYIRTLHVDEGNLDSMQPFFHAMLQTSFDILEVVETLSQQHSFDFVYFDMFGAGELVRDYLQIPGIGSNPSFVLQEAHFDTPLYRKDEKADHLLESIQERFGVQPTRLMQFMKNRGELNIVYTSEYFQPSVDAVNDSFVFIGPSFLKRADQHDFPLEALEQEKVVFISMGTVLGDTEAFFNMCIDAFADFDGKVVLATGEKVDRSLLKEAPSHFLIEPYVPQLEVLELTDVFVTHGGMNSVNEGIHYNVPMVVIPIDKDQPMVAQRLTELSAARALDKDQLTAKQLRETVESVLESNTYRAGIEKIEESFQTAGGTDKALRSIDQWMKTKQTQS